MHWHFWMDFSLTLTKLQVLGCATTRRQHQLPRSLLIVDGTTIDPVQSARDLGIFTDANLVMRTHVQMTVSRCFTVLRQLRSIRHSMPTTTFQTHRLAGTVEAGLPKCRFGQSFSLLSSPTSVGDERGSTAHLRCASHRPHLGCTHHPPLAPSPREGIIQDGRTHVQGLSSSRAAIPESAGSCRRSPWSTLSLFCSDQPSAVAVRETVYRWRPSFPRRRNDHLELSVRTT